MKKIITTLSTMLIISYGSVFSQNATSQLFFDTQVNNAQTKMANTLMKNNLRPIDDVYNIWYQHLSPTYDTSLVEVQIKDSGEIKSFNRLEDELTIIKTPIVNGLLKTPIIYESSTSKNADLFMPIILGLNNDTSYIKLFD